MQYFTLNHRIAFYVPSTSDTDKPVSKEILQERTNDIAKLLTSYFGGATIENVQGFYKSKNGKYAVETIRKVISFASDEDLAKHSETIINIASNRVKLWKQESIGLEIDSKFYLID